MKVYSKDGVKANADKDQWPALEEAEWTRTPSEKKEVPEEKEVEENKLEVPVEKAPMKRRKPIVKKSDSED